MVKTYTITRKSSTYMEVPTTTALRAIPEVEGMITGVIVWEGVTKSDLADAHYNARRGWPSTPRVTMRVVGRNGEVYFGTKPKALIGFQASAVVAFKASSVSESKNGAVSYFKRPSKARELGSLTEETGFLPA